ncbi:Toll-like receptor 8 [Merluccius polli]|uniref:Toll-like receptor 8 n=1 Tax=Merluccius polli TaxID=89951 RepID=A0AA47NTK1_MERPO|nr:Toll-like receptor 8 [Merluccius polli]
MKGMGHRFEFIHSLTKLEVPNLSNNGIGMRIDLRLSSNLDEYVLFWEWPDNVGGGGPDVHSFLPGLQCLYFNTNHLKVLTLLSLPLLLNNGTSLQLLIITISAVAVTTPDWNFLRTSNACIPYLTTAVKCEFPERECPGHTTVKTSVDVWYCLQILWAGCKGYTHPAASCSPKHYDAFVVFDTDNQAVRDWFYNELVVLLESSDYKRLYLCLERDWIPGLSCILKPPPLLLLPCNSSEKTVCLLSNGTSNGVGGRSRSRTAGQDVSQAEVPPAKEEVVQQVSDILA